MEDIILGLMNSLIPESLDPKDLEDWVGEIDSDELAAFDESDDSSDGDFNIDESSFDVEAENEIPGENFAYKDGDIEGDSDVEFEEDFEEIDFPSLTSEASADVDYEDVSIPLDFPDEYSEDSEDAEDLGDLSIFDVKIEDTEEFTGLEEVPEIAELERASSTEV